MIATTFTTSIQWLAGLMAGGLIGAGFGVLQQSARQRYEKLQRTGGLNSEWKVVRGSSRRITFLLVALALVQVICPMLFKDGTQWWVSGGVIAGYAVMLARQMRRRMAASR